MKGRVRSALAIVTVSLAALACNAETPALSDANADGPPCSRFADQLVAFTPGTGGPSDAGEAALGMPDGASVTLGVDASLTVAFVGAGALTDAEGDDIDLTTTASADAEAVAYVSDDGVEFRFAGDLSADVSTIDVSTASASRVTELRIIGVAGELAIDAIEALTVDCTAL